jgi:hypothetical protein
VSAEPLTRNDRRGYTHTDLFWFHYFGFQACGGHTDRKLSSFQNKESRLAVQFPVHLHYKDQPVNAV